MANSISSPFISIAALIKKLDMNDDSIVMDNKIKNLTQDFLAIILEHDCTLKDALQYFNEEALNDSNFAMNFAMLFSSKVFNNLVNVTKFRAEIMNLLQSNYLKADTYKSKDLKQFYNSITLLGEYYYRYRIAKNPVNILGKSLFELLTKQLQDEITCCLSDSSHIIDLQFSKLILTQISLNGSLARTTHKSEIDALLYEVRKCLIEVQNLTSQVKALFLMTLDLYYYNFASIGKHLEKFYETFLNDVEKKLHPINQLGLIKEAENIQNPIEKCQTLVKALNSDGIIGQQIAFQQNKILKEHIGKPLKASERLKLAQKVDPMMLLLDESNDLSATFDGVAIDDQNIDVNVWWGTKSIESTTEQLNTTSADDNETAELDNQYLTQENATITTINDTSTDEWYEDKSSGQSYAKPFNSMSVSKSCNEINHCTPVITKDTNDTDVSGFEFKVFSEKKSNINWPPVTQQLKQQKKYNTTTVNGSKNDRNETQRRMQMQQQQINRNLPTGINNRKDMSSSQNNSELHNRERITTDDNSTRFNVHKHLDIHSRPNNVLPQTLADEESWD